MADRLVLETPRLRLRPFTLADASALQRGVSPRAIADTTLTLPHPYLDGMAESWIAITIEQHATGAAAHFAITDRSDDTLLGSIGLERIAAGHQAEVGYWIDRAHWGRGLCTEAGQAVLHHAFVTLDLVRVHAQHFTRNPASGRVMQKLGMQHEGTRRKHALRFGVLEDVELYGILRDR